MKKKLLAAMLSLLMLMSVAPLTALADEEDTQLPEGIPTTVSDEEDVQLLDVTPTTVSEPVSDADTRYNYRYIFDLNHTRYDGRIWTDKTVMTKDITYTGKVHYPDKEGTGSVTIRKASDEDFLVSYSALASTSSIISQTNAPMDLVLVLDLSPQINSEVGKTEAMLNAVDQAIEAMLEANSRNRISIVGFSNQAVTLLPLDNYKSVTLTYAQNDPNNVRLGATVTCSFTNTDDISGSESFTIAANNDSGVNKYTQMGIYTGMNLLLKSDTTVMIGDDNVTRQPVMILLSEGEPKIASTNITQPTPSLIGAGGWSDFDSTFAYESEMGDAQPGGVEIMRNYGISDAAFGSNHGARHAQTFATLLTAAYMKQQVTEHYYPEVAGSADGSESSDRAALVYTVGIRTSSANSPELAEIVLAPSTYLNSGTNDYSDTFIDYAEEYLAGEVSVGDAGRNDHETTFTYIDDVIDSVEDLKYNDMFFDVTGNGSDLEFGDVFGDILTDITSSAAQGSTQVDPDDSNGHESGWLTYTDPIGEYMEVKDVKALIINDVIYTDCDEYTDGDTTTYVFSGLANNPVYGAHQLSDIVIEVVRETDANNKITETINVNIPASLIPLRLTNILKNEDGDVISYSHNNTYPFRLVYSVGTQSGVLVNGAVNMEVISEDYINTHTGADGGVYFYEGLYTAQTMKDGNGLDKTVGDAYVTYTPATNNPFYYVNENTYLYLDDKLTQPANASEFDSTDTYYFAISYYTQNAEGVYPAAVPTTAIVERPGLSLRPESLDRDPITGQWYIKEGQPRLGYLTDFMREKTGSNGPNNTNTAEVYLYLSWEGQNSDGHHNFKVFHGNNGRLSAPLPDGVLSVTKIVEGDDAPVSSFNFTLTVDGEETTNFALVANETKTFDIDPDSEWSVVETTVLDSDQWSTTVTANNGTVTEADPPGISGTMEAGGSTNVVFTNKYTTPTGKLTIQKFVTGDTNLSDVSSFTFTLVTTDNGVINTTPFTLSPNQTYEVTLDEGTTWTVTETSNLDRNWETTITDANGEPSNGRSISGTIVADSNATVAFTNEYTAPGILTISKTVAGGTLSAPCEFIVELTDDSDFNGTISGVQFTDGEAQITLDHGDIKTINLPDGTAWRVTEITAMPEGWTTTVGGNAGNSIAGTISSGESSAAAFVNSAPGKLVVTKDVVGGNGDEQFNFTLNYTGGSSSFTLVDDGSYEITLPAGATYTVAESNLPEGWTSTIEGLANGTIEAGITHEVRFTNTAAGTVTITKHVVGGSTGQRFEFKMTYGDVTETFELGDGENKSFTISAGTAWSIEETAVNRWISTAAGETSGIIEAGKNYTVEFTNTYRPYSPVTPTEPDEPDTPDSPEYDGPQLNRDDHFGYIVGRTDTEVFPGDNMTRAEVATVFFRLLTDESRAEYWSNTNGFSDIESEAWYNNAVSTMSNAGVITGYDDDTFRPNAPITRAEFAAMAVRFYGEVGEYSSDAFNDIASSWARNYINRAYELELIGGYPDGSFRPNNNITRAEVITIINSMLDREPDADHLHREMKIWADNSDPTAWYYADIQEATNSHTYEAGTDYEVWTGIEPLRDWVSLEQEWSDVYRI